MVERGISVRHRTQGFDGAAVAVFESRLSDVMAKAVAAYGGAALSAPSVREVPLASNREALAFGERLVAGRVDVVIFMTGVGARVLIDTLAERYPRTQVVEALRRTVVVARGPKPVRALKEFGVPTLITVPEPSTWHEIVQALDVSDRSIELSGRAVAIQEYGAENVELIDALRRRGAEVSSVPVYQWALPEDLSPLREAIGRIIEGSVPFALFTNAVQVRHLLKVAGPREPELREALSRMVIGSIGPTTSDALLDAGLHVDYEASHPRMGLLIDEVATQADALLERKREELTRVEVRSPATDTSGSPSSCRDSLFLKACRREPTSTTPVWLMRQAGRFLPEYRAIRNRVPFLELCKRPDLVAEVTTMAVERLGVDAAILFSDILLIVEPLGFTLEFTTGDGPVIRGQVATAADIDAIPAIDPNESLRFVFDAVRQTRRALPSDIPLIGFAAAPFTLAAYLIEGGASKTFLQTKTLMHADSGAWHALLGKISRALAAYLNGQIAAGADAVQVFDSWVGCIGPRDYQEFVLPHVRSLIQSLHPGVPVIHFGTGTGAFLDLVRQAGGDVIGVDFRVELDQAWRAIGHDAGIQGNLDPAVLCAPVDTIRQRVQRILRQAGGRPGHVFNLGHGVLPSTPPDHARAMVDAVHELSRREARAAGERR